MKLLDKDNDISLKYEVKKPDKTEKKVESSIRPAIWLELFLVVLAVFFYVKSGGELATSSTLAKKATSQPIKKPESISMLINSDKDLSGFRTAYESLTGIKLDIEQISEGYENSLRLKQASNSFNYDVFTDNFSHSTDYEAVAWDMLDTWKESTSQGKLLIDSTYIDSLKLKGKLYGFPVNTGSLSGVYIRGGALEKAPQTYDEFIEALKSNNLTFSGPFKDCSPEEIDIYFRPFFQDANPDIYYNQFIDKYVDGFSENAMVAALERLQLAYSEGLIDSSLWEYSESDFINGLEIDEFDSFSTSRTVKEEYIKLSLKNINNIISLPPIWVIPANAPNPEGVFKHFIMFSHDGGRGQTLFTYGISEDFANENNLTFNYSIDESKVYTKAEGFDYLIINPTHSLTKWQDPFNNSGIFNLSFKLIKESNITIYPMPYSPSSFDEINSLKLDLIKRTVLGEMTAKECVAKYQEESKELVNTILSELN